MKAIQELTNSHIPIVINVGDIMYEALSINLKIAEMKSSILEKLKLNPKKYYLATIHRAENASDKDRLKNILEAFIELSKEKIIDATQNFKSKSRYRNYFGDSNTSNIILKIITRLLQTGSIFI